MMIKEVGLLHGHKDWVTAMVVALPTRENEDTQVLVTGSRDKTILIWKLNLQAEQVTAFGEPVTCLTGHNHFISDLALTAENNFLLSASWDKTMRLWDLRKKQTTAIFKKDGHTREILSCAISNDGRFIISSGADRAVKIWNIKGECKITTDEYPHSDWVTRVRFIGSSSKTSTSGQFFTTVGWDGYLKVWTQSGTIKDSITVHDGSINAVAVSPRGNFIVTGGRDKKVKVFDFVDVSKQDLAHDAPAPVNCLAFNPKSQWVAIGTETGWQIWDFENKDKPIFADNFDLDDKKEEPEKVVGVGVNPVKPVKPPKMLQVTSLTWNSTGNKLFIGYQNGVIRVAEIFEDKSV